MVSFALWRSHFGSKQRVIRESERLDTGSQVGVFAIVLTRDGASLLAVRV